MEPESGFSKTYVSTGVGTVVLKDAPGYVKRVVIGGTYVGTLQIDDSATAAGTTATSTLITVPIPALNTMRSIDLDIQCRSGILYQATGTPVLTIVWK